MMNRDLRELLDLCRELSGTFNVTFFIFGQTEEEDILNFIKTHSASDMVIVLNGPLSKVTALIKQMDCFIANGSSLMHVATAVGVPTVGIFGPTNHVDSPFSPKGAIVCSGQKIEKDIFFRVRKMKMPAVTHTPLQE